MIDSTSAAIVYMIGTLTLLVFTVFLVLIVREYRKRQERHLKEKLKLEHRYESEVLQTRLEVQEQSFKYVSEEIHDNISQILSLAKLRLYKTAEKTGDEQVRAGIEMSTELVGNALNDLRNLSHVLNGSLVSKLSLSESIEKELAYARDAKDIKTQLIQEGAACDLRAEKKLMIFRIVQEAINNAIKHGEAGEINVILHYQPEKLVVKIADNGKGFDLTQAENNNGLGLHNMQVRARLLGSIVLQSAQDSGTIITLNIDTHESKN